MREWLSGGAPPCQGGGRGFDPRLALFVCSEKCFQGIFLSYGKLCFLYDKKLRGVYCDSRLFTYGHVLTNENIFHIY